MMHGSGSGGDHFVVPASVMSFPGLEGSGGGGGGSSSQSHGQKQHMIWEWETASGGSSHDLNTSSAALHHNHAFFPGATAPPPFVDCPAPPLLPMNSFPFYLPPAAPALPPPEYQMGLIKSEEGGGGRIIGLNLGHRTYFCPGDHSLSIDRLFAAGSSSVTTRGLLYPFSCSQPPRCQAEGCKVDLSGAKHYHRRHKVCELHSKAAVVIVAGLQQRFCQQCSRFHVLAEFDDAKRSCRKRLADHNRRRRKPPPPPPSHGADSSSSSHEKTKSQSQNSARDDSTVHATRKGAALLTLNGGGVAAEKENITGTNNSVAMHRAQGIAINVAVGEEKLSEEEQQQQQHNVASSSSSRFNGNNAAAAYFHHHNLFCSSSHDAEAAATAAAGGAGGSGGQSGASDHQHHHLFGLGHQTLFEVDYM